MNRARVAGGMVMPALMVAACISAAHAQPAQDGANAPDRCARLVGSIISADQMTLPTSGARVLSATFLAAGAAGPTASTSYCKVLATIVPIDAHGQPITVQLNLPSVWNGKAVQMGGGGLDGFLITADGPGPGANAEPTPLSAGYATFGSDGGHSVANPFDANAQTQAFLSDEVLANYGGDQLKKTRDLAMALIRLHYDHAPRRTYFVGASEGGREALVVAQRWGADYDGVIAFYPAAGGVPMVTAFGRDSRALSAPGAYPNRAKQALLHQAVLAACDALDGAADGIISNPASCRFDVATLRCPSGRDAGDSCLSDAQIAALKVLSEDLHLRHALPSGETGFPGYRVFQGVDLTAPISGLGASPPGPPPVTPTQPIHFVFYDVFVRGLITRDPVAAPLAFDPEHPGPWTARVSQISTIMDSARSDLSVFRRHGGRLILVHGNDDSLIPVGWSDAYYLSVVQRLGRASVDGFMRYYAVPGYGHGFGAFTVDWDSLTALDRWVEGAAAPDEPVVMDVTPGHAGRTRPLCRFPAWPRYAGSGDMNKASSFTCVHP